MTHSMFNNYNPDEEGHTWYGYTGDMRDYFESDSGWDGGADFDKNGRQTSLFNNYQEYYPVEYDWDGRVRKNQNLNYTMGMEAKYTPEGVRTWKKRKWGSSSYSHKYIIDTSGEIPNILLVIDANDANKSIVKTYIHANNEILAQHDGRYNTPRYFYLHDRLGSIRQIVDVNGSVVNSYFYTPYGGTTGTETRENIKNWYTWAGYYSEDELDGYYCNARVYSAGRFMTRDPVAGQFTEPMSLHVYLYCNNDPINHTDPTGQQLWGAIRYAYRTVQSVNMYYGFLAGNLEITGNPADMLKWLPATNTFREYLFSQEYLNRHFNWEIQLEAYYRELVNICDWGELTECLALDWTHIFPVLDIAGYASCAICAGTVIIPDPIPIADEAISCGACAFYMSWIFPVTHNPIVKGLQGVSTFQSVSKCLNKHCKMGN